MSQRRKPAPEQDAAPRSDSLMLRLLGMLLMMALCVFLFYSGMKFFQGIEAEKEWAKRRDRPTTQQSDAAQSDAKAKQPNQRRDYAFYHALSGDKPVVAGQVAIPPQRNAGESVTGANYRVQVGAFRQQEQANRMRARMILRDYPVVITQSGAFYLVQIGPYQHKETAQRIQQRLKREGVDTLLKSYVN